MLLKFVCDFIVREYFCDNTAVSYDDNFCIGTVLKFIIESACAVCALINCMYAVSNITDGADIWENSFDSFAVKIVIRFFGEF